MKTFDRYWLIFSDGKYDGYTSYDSAYQAMLQAIETIDPDCYVSKTIPEEI